MARFSLASFLVLLALVAASSALYLGFGGVVGKLTPRTGTKWPPFKGAGQGKLLANMYKSDVGT